MYLNLHNTKIKSLREICKWQSNKGKISKYTKKSVRLQKSYNVTEENVDIFGIIRLQRLLHLPEELRSLLLHSKNKGYIIQKMWLQFLRKVKLRQDSLLFISPLSFLVLLQYF